MARRQLFEFEDQPWLPSALRDYMTDALRGVLGELSRWTGMSRVLARRLATLLEHTDDDRIVDLCSGGSGPLAPIVEELERLGRRPRVLLTDKYPNVPTLEALRRDGGGRFDFVATSVDATAVPADLEGVRTLFAAFHHFDDDAALSILRDAAEQGRSLAVFEASERHPVMALAMPLVPLAVLLGTPFFRPFRLGRLVFTYLIPIVPALVFWDGVVSCWRTRSPAELRDLADRVDVPGYRFEAGQDPVRGLPVRVTWLLGYPVNDALDGRGDGALKGALEGAREAAVVSGAGGLVNVLGDETVSWWADTPQAGLARGAGTEQDARRRRCERRPDQETHTMPRPRRCP